MILDNIANTLDAYIYMERYVNNESPSNFPAATSEYTSPTGKGSGFNLKSIQIPEYMSYEDFGNFPSFIGSKTFLLHPDMLKEKDLCIPLRYNIEESFLVEPMASARTVLVKSSDPFFVKLSYKSLIGRFPRQIARPQALSAVELTTIIDDAFRKKVLPGNLMFFREYAARVVDFPQQDNSIYECGMVIRDYTPYPLPGEYFMSIPGFSLFGKDKNVPDDPSILYQLFCHQTDNVEDFLLNKIIYPILEGYFELLIKCGLCQECHSQNILFVVDKHYHVIGVAFRDLESIDKDLSVMKLMGIPTSFKSKSWKCISTETPNYKETHSFMFDFKLGEYLLTPIIDEVCGNGDGICDQKRTLGWTKKYGVCVDRQMIISKIRLVSDEYIKLLPNYFPDDGCWYSYPKTIRDRTKPREYIITSNPKYRKV